MIWWFLILGVSTLVVVCVAIALFMRLRRHLQVVKDAEAPARTVGAPPTASNTDISQIRRFFHGKNGNSTLSYFAGAV